MMKNFLKHTIQQFVDMTEEELDVLLNAFQSKTYPKRHILVEKGKIASHVYFICKGSLRLFYESKDKEITGNISTEGMFLSAHESFLSQVPSEYMIESIEETEVLEISYPDYVLLSKENPKLYLVAVKILERRLKLARLTIEWLVTLTPEEHYLKIMEENPNWLQKIPHYIIASYMGISPVSLSRIRKRIQIR